MNNGTRPVFAEGRDPFSAAPGQAAWLAQAAQALAAQIRPGEQILGASVITGSPDGSQQVYAVTWDKPDQVLLCPAEGGKR